ncbi:unnamed protein product [Rhizophagus irregularis]|nr:unnamed protein product [Rhizophagus irregularis]
MLVNVWSVKLSTSSISQVFLTSAMPTRLSLDLHGRQGEMKVQGRRPTRKDTNDKTTSNANAAGCRYVNTPKMCHTYLGFDIGPFSLTF